LIILILSRGRVNSITSHKLFPSAKLVCIEEEERLYRNHGLETVIIPKSVIGLGAIRNWCLDNFKDKTVVMVDDDIKHLACIARENSFRITDPDAILQIVENTALCAEEAGTVFFGFNQAWDVRKYQGNRPFALVCWIGGVVGIIGRDFRFDENNKLKVDIDYSLQTLLKKRIIWTDNRFSFVQIRNNNTGGNVHLRSLDLYEKEIKYLKEKWGTYYSVKRTRTGEKIGIRVKRKQSILL